MMWNKHFVRGLWTQAIVPSYIDSMKGLMPLSLMGLKCLLISGADNGEEELDVKQEEGKSRLYTLPLLLPPLMTYDDANDACVFCCAAAHTLGMGTGGSERWDLGEQENCSCGCGPLPTRWGSKFMVIPLGWGKAQWPLLTLLFHFCSSHFKQISPWLILLQSHPGKGI